MKLIEGNPMTNIHSILSMAVVVISGAILIYQGVPAFEFILTLMVLTIGFYFLTGPYMYSFGIDSNFLYIDNYWFFWYEKHLPIQTIQKVVFKVSFKGIRSIEIFYENKSKEWICDSLDDETFKDFFFYLRENGIKTQVNEKLAKWVS